MSVLLVRFRPTEIFLRTSRICSGRPGSSEIYGSIWFGWAMHSWFVVRVGSIRKLPSVFLRDSIRVFSRHSSYAAVPIRTVAKSRKHLGFYSRSVCMFILGKSFGSDRFCAFELFSGLIWAKALQWDAAVFVV